MKSMFVLMLAGVLVAACGKPVPGEVGDSGEEWTEAGAPSRPVRFSVAGTAWSVTRSLEADGKAMTDLWVYDYMDGSLVRTAHKSEGDVDIDQPVLGMKYGRHRVYFVASRGKSPGVDGSEVVWGQVSDTFWKAVDVEVGSGSASVVPVVLDRVVARLSVQVTDALPEGAATLTVEPSAWWAGLDYVTGAAVGESLGAKQVVIPAAYIGREGGLSAAFFCIGDAGEWLSDLEIAVRDADGEAMGSVTLRDVPFERNRQTTVRGGLFSAARGFLVSLGDEWRDECVIEW